MQFNGESFDFLQNKASDDAKLKCIAEYTHECERERQKRTRMLLISKTHTKNEIYLKALQCSLFI